MSDNSPLHYKALLAWREEMERRRREALADKETPLGEGLRRRLTAMFGAEHPVEVEVWEGDPYDLVLWAEVEGLRFLGFRGPDDRINVVLVAKCSRCGREISGDPLTRLADLGRELTQFGMSGIIGEHHCTQRDETTLL
jgi:hypothetical protein